MEKWTFDICNADPSSKMRPSELSLKVFRGLPTLTANHMQAIVKRRQISSDLFTGAMSSTWVFEINDPGSIKCIHIIIKHVYTFIKKG